MNHLEKGAAAPDVTIRTRDNGSWSELRTGELFDGRTVVVFSLPGAFTPTCSSSHVPRYEELYEDFKAAGVDEIVCVSVNDAFVMDAWKEQQGADHITFLPDGNGTFTKAMGMLVDKDDLGFGARSWRYAMVVRDGIIDAIFPEPEKPGDPFEASDADSVLEALGASHTPDILMITRDGCQHCVRAKGMLAEADLPYVERASGPRVLRALPGKLTTPQVFIDGAWIGGADELGEWLAARS